ncbi:hypothetical protein [Canicola haemoglobinophilus]|uniref:hypothetical protein n=1 Tax=Canicola haemoglobinophilus TaxID=733 RepID=UPI0015F1529F|nr:hypothetical protein [Canicola haemoglobinophilus]
MLAADIYLFTLNQAVILELTYFETYPNKKENKTPKILLGKILDFPWLYKKQNL